MEGAQDSQVKREAAPPPPPPVVPFPKLQLRNPFVLKMFGLTTGIGIGCGIGIGVGKPINLGALGSVLPVGEINRLMGKSGHHVQRLKKKFNIKTLDAGIGCGVGVGHGFVLVGLGLKPGVPEQILQFAQDTVAALVSRVGPHLGPIADKVGLPGVAAQDSSTAATTGSPGNTLLSNFSRAASTGGAATIPSASLTGLNKFMASPSATSPSPSPLLNTSSRAQENNEVERLKLEKEILQTLLRQQKQIEDLREELKSLYGDGKQEVHLRSKKISASVEADGEGPHQCFECRRRARRRL